MKTKVAIVTLGDSRVEFFAKREHMVAEELEKLIGNLGKTYEVFAPETVFTVEQAQERADEIRAKGICCVILHIPVWATPNLALRVAYSTSLPVMLLGNKRPDSSSIVSLLAIAGMLDQSGRECIRLVGDISHEDVRAKVDAFITACNVVDGIRRSSFCMIGGRSIGIATTVADPAQWQKVFGTEFDHCDQFEIVYRAEQIAPERVRQHLDWVKRSIPRIEYGGLFTAETLERQVRSYLALKDLAAEHGYDFLGLKCQQDLSDHYVLQCLGVALLNNSYDAEGAKPAIPCSCECDCDGAMTMRMLSLCAGGRPSNLVDIKFFDSKEQTFILANCGAVAPYFADPDDPAAALGKMTLMQHVFGKAGGAALQMVAKSGTVTVARLFRKNGQYVLGAFEGTLEDRPIEELRKTTWCYPHEFVKADVDYEQFFQTIGSNHLHTVYGSHCETLRLICRMEKIEFLCYNR